MAHGREAAIHTVAMLLGVTRAELARRTGLHISRVERILNRKRVATEAEWQAFAHALGTDLKTVERVHRGVVRLVARELGR